MSSSISGAMIVYTIITSIMFIVIVASNYFFLYHDPERDAKGPRRWAGIQSKVLWRPWAATAGLMAVAYGLFFGYFVLSEEQEKKNSFYHVVCVISLFLCVSVAQWAYLLRRFESNSWLYRNRNGCLQCGEVVCALPCYCDPSSRCSVVCNPLLSFTLSVVMLILFCIGAADSGYTDNEYIVLGALVYMVLYLGALDFLFWGYTWYNETVSDFNEEGLKFYTIDDYYAKGLNPKEVGTQSEMATPTTLWSDVRLLRSPLLPLPGRPPALRVDDVVVSSMLGPGLGV